MIDDRRDTVVVEKDRSSNPLGWIIGVVLLLLLLLWFFTSGGFGLFGGAGETAAPADNNDSINIETPDSINVQPNSGQ